MVYTQMRWRQRDVEITEKCSEATLSLIGEDEAERIEGVGRFNYLGILLDRSDDVWPALLHNIRKARQVWGWLGKILRMKGAETTFLEKFYRTVFQDVLLFESETRMFLTPIMQRLEGTHVGFLQQATIKRQRG